MKAALLFLLLLTLEAIVVRAAETPAARPDAETPAASHDAPAPAVSTPASDSSTPAPSPAVVAILGTWRLAKADGQSIAVPFYMRLSPDGSALLWPIESGCAHPEHRISRAAFTLDGETFTFIKNGSDTVVSACTLDGDTLTLRTPQGHEIIYRRDPDAPAPGHLPGETPAPAGEHSAHP